jgi:DNA-binding IclR family transcriptional regulator
MALSPTIVQRLIHSLVNSNFLMKDEQTRKYSLGYRALSLGSSLLSEDNLISAAMPVLSRLAREFQVNAFLSIITGDKLVYALALQSSGPISIRTAPGSLAALHSTAMGKAILAEEPDERARALLAAHPLEPFTERTITDPDRLMDELAAVRRLGYAISDEENLPGVAAVGAAIRNSGGRAIAGVSSAFAPMLQPDVKMAQIVRQTVLAANEISQNLGCPAACLIPLVTPQAVGEDAS